MLDELYERLRFHRRNRSPATLSRYARTIPRFIETVNESGIATPIELSIEFVDTYVDELLAEYDRDATILTHTKNVRVWLSWLETRNCRGEHVYLAG